MVLPICASLSAPFGGDMQKPPVRELAKLHKCNGIADVTLEYTGNGTVDIFAYDKTDGTLTVEVSGASNGDTIFIDEIGPATGKRGPETTIGIYDSATGTLLDIQTIHTSCSLDKGTTFGDLVVIDVSRIMDLQDMFNLTSNVILMLVQADEGLARTALDDAISAGGDTREIGRAEGEMTKAAQELGKGKPDKAIDHYKAAWEHALKALKKLSQPGDALCAGNAKPGALTMTYMSGGANDSSHSQDDKKVSVDPEEPISALIVHIIASDKKKADDSKARVWFEGNVAYSGKFHIDATNAGEQRLGAETYVHIFGESGELLQTVKFHTSCSQPLNIGDQFGSVQLVEFIAQGAAPQASPSRLPPYTFTVPQPYPQPCNPEVWLPYTLGQGVDVNITIYTTSGQAVRNLRLGHQNAGAYVDKARAAHWDGKNEAGEQISSGVYFYIIQAGDFTATRKVVVAK